MTKEERLERQKQKLSEMRSCEDSLRKNGYRYIAGVDEAGRGPLAGPVVAAAVVLPEDFDVIGVDDSKKLSEKKREELFGIIQERAVSYGIGVVDEAEIDAINILQATKAAMKLAVCEAERRLAGCDAPCAAGPAGADLQAAGVSFRKIDYILFDAMEIEELPVLQKSIVKGDAKVLAIAAASILAKVTRDRMMAEYAKQYPGYGFEKNKGYGTKAHYAGLAAHGICPIHRRSFLKKWQAGG